MYRKIAVLTVAAVVLAGCADMEQRPKQTIGTILGAAGGAVAGAQFGKGTGRLVATAIGTLAGAWIGSEAGQSLDRADQAHIQQLTQRSLETQKSNTTVLWTNPDHDVEATVTPKPVFTDTAGQTCREYQQTVTVGGKTELAYGTACREADGSWRIIK